MTLQDVYLKSTVRLPDGTVGVVESSDPEDSYYDLITVVKLRDKWGYYSFETRRVFIGTEVELLFSPVEYVKQQYSELYDGRVVVTQPPDKK